MRDNFEDFMFLAEYDRKMEHNKWRQEIPYIKFPSEWEIQVSPPSGGAVVRFKIKKGIANTSVYLDCYDNLGVYRKPYWEVYPINNDVFRCDMEDTTSLLEAIDESLKQQLINA